MDQYPLISKDDIERRVKEMGLEITKQFVGKELVVICVLKGAFIFMSDLVRQIDLPVRCEFMRLSSYENDRSSGQIRVEFDLVQPIHNQHVLVVEDIVDTGRTLRFLKNHLKAKDPASVSFCSLLYKEIDSTVRPLLDYVGFIIPNDYVIGYGMDSNGLYRTLPYIAVQSEKKK